MLGVLAFFTLRASRDPTAMRKFRKLTYWGTYLVYTRISVQCFELFNCTTVDGVSYIASDVSSQCHDRAWRLWVVIDVLFIALIPIGFPLVVFVNLYRHRSRLDLAGIRYEMECMYLMHSLARHHLHTLAPAPPCTIDASWYVCEWCFCLALAQ